MTNEIKCKSCNGTGQVLVEGDESMVDRMTRCPECQGTGTAPISPYACDKCRDTGWKEIPETAHESAGRVTCDCARGKDLLADKRAEAAFQWMFRAERERLKARNFAENYQAGPEKFGDSLSKLATGAAIPDPAEASASYDPDSLSFYVELDKCAKRINPNGVHAIVRDQAIVLETYDLGVSFEEQQKFDLPPQVTILGVLPAEVLSQLMMNNIDPSASPDSSTIKFWIDVFQEMGPDYFAALKKLVAKLEWTV